MGINYNNELEMFKKGSVLISATDSESGEEWKTNDNEEKKHLQKRAIQILHCDVIGEKFWESRAELLLSLKQLKRKKKEDYKIDLEKIKKVKVDQ